MQITTKFSNGDKVWHIKQEMRYEWKECDFCGGSGEIMGFNQQFKLCPQCIGKRGWNEQWWLRWEVTGPLTIGEIRARVRGEDPVGMQDNIAWEYSPPGIKGLSRYSNYGSQEAEYEEQYMCRETGIGGGTIYYPDTLFATEAEALEKCRERNNSDLLPVNGEQSPRRPYMGVDHAG